MTTRQSIVPALGMADSPVAFFEPDDVVALVRDWPEEGLEAGVWGAIVALIDAEHALVEFTNREGEVMRTLATRLDQVELVWSEPG